VEKVTIVKPRLERFQFIAPPNREATVMYDDEGPKNLLIKRGKSSTRSNTVSGGGQNQSLADVIAHAQNFLFKNKGVKARMAEEE
jgi:hypothetical protein